MLYMDRKPASHTDCSLLIHPQITVRLSQLSSLTQSGHSDPSDVNVFFRKPILCRQKVHSFFFFPAVKHYPQRRVFKKWISILAFYNAEQFLISIFNRIDHKMILKSRLYYIRLILLELCYPNLKVNIGKNHLN